MMYAGLCRYTCCAVKTLEQFRHVVSAQLEEESKLRTARALFGVRATPTFACDVVHVWM